MRTPERDVESVVLSSLDTARPTCLVVSPHLDDAVLSCADLLSVLARQAPVVVATVFTDAGPPPWPVMARRIMRASGHRDAAALFAQRHDEDRAVLARLGALPLHLGFLEAPFRRSRRRVGMLATYPTFRFDALRGRVAAADGVLAADLVTLLGGLADEHRAGMVLAPLGIGRHVDHLIARNTATAACAERSLPLIYYSDFPYSSRSEPDADFVRRRGLVRFPRAPGRDVAPELIAGYRTQFPVLFPNGVIPSEPECYWAQLASPE